MQCLRNSGKLTTSKFPRPSLLQEKFKMCGQMEYGLALACDQQSTSLVPTSASSRYPLSRVRKKTRDGHPTESHRYRGAPSNPYLGKPAGDPQRTRGSLDWRHVPTRNLCHSRRQSRKSELGKSFDMMSRFMGPLMDAQDAKQY